jgi:hypothetical protein
VQPLAVLQFSKERWQVVFKLPPGLTPGWHDVRVRLRDSRPSNALRIAVDMPLESGPIRIAGVCDGTTWTPNDIDLKKGSALSLWVQGLPENADRANVRVYLADVRLEVMYIEPARPNEPRQLNVIAPREAESGVAQLVAMVGEQRSEPVEIAIRGGSVNEQKS